MRLRVTGFCSLLAAACLGCGAATDDGKGTPEGEVQPPMDPASACQPVGRFLIGRSGRTWSHLECAGRAGGTAVLAVVRGSAPDDVWVGGPGGTALHWDGRVWSRLDTGTGGDVTTLWVGGPGNAFAVAGVAGGAPFRAQEVLRWDGQVWAMSYRPINVPVQGLWGSGPTDVWAASGGIELGLFVKRWDGSRWSDGSKPQVFGSSAQPMGLGGTSANDVWLVRDFGALSHWNGEVWTERSNGPPQRFFAGPIWAAGPDEAWATGDLSNIYRFKDGRWTEEVPGTEFKRGDVAGTAANDVWWAAGDRLAHWDGTRWTTELSGRSVISVWAVGRDVWVVGEESILHSR